MGSRCRDVSGGCAFVEAEWGSGSANCELAVRCELAQQAQLAQAKEIVNTLTAEDAQRVTLVAAKTPPQPQGKAIYLRRKGSLIFLANNLAPLPPQRAYELWLLPPTGSPIPAGVFKPDSHGSATVVNPPLPPGVEAKGIRDHGGTGRRDRRRQPQPSSCWAPENRNPEEVASWSGPS